MMKMKRYEKQYTVQQVFVLMVLALFMVFSTLLVVLGALGYCGMEERSSATNEKRILCAFVCSAVQSQETGGNILVDGDVLMIENNYDGEIYRQYIYAHEGMLRQQFISADRSFAPENGDAVCPSLAFSPQMKGNVLYVEMQDGQGNSLSLYEAVRTMPGEGGSL